MYKRELPIGHGVLSIETGKLAKQANGSVLVRFGDTRGARDRVLRGRRAPGHRLPPAHGRLPRIHVRLRADPRRVLQARGQADREGSADEPRDRPAAPPALPRRLAPRNADHRARPLGRRRQRLRTCSPSPAPRRRSPCPRSPFEKTIAAVRVALLGDEFVINPTYAQRKPGSPRHRRGGQPRRPRDGRSWREGRRRGPGGPGARGRARGDQADRRHDRPNGAGSREAQGDGREEGDQSRLLPRGRGEGLAAARRGDADPGQDRELRGGGSDPRGTRGVVAGGGGRTPARSQGHLQGAEGEGPARRGSSSAASGSTAAQFDEIRPIWIEVGVLPRVARVGRLHPRRDAGARDGHARHRRGPAEGRDGRAGSTTSASCCTTTSRRSRSARWRSCAARAAARSATARWPSGRWRR